MADNSRKSVLLKKIKIRTEKYTKGRNKQADAVNVLTLLVVRKDT